MFLKTFAALLVATGVAVGGAQATPLPDPLAASYDGIYDITNARSTHGLYLPGLLKDPNGPNPSTYWQVQSGKATLNQGSLTLEGQVKNLTPSFSNLEMEFLFELSILPDQNRSVYCGRSGAGSCNDPDPAAVAARGNVQFFNLDKATISGLGSLAGLDLDVSVFPLGNAKPPQLGYGGNWFNMDFGYSNWFTYASNVTQIAGFDVKQQSFDQNGKPRHAGDLNISFVGNDDSLTTVPVPGALPLLSAGLLAFGVVARRKRAA